MLCISHFNIGMRTIHRMLGTGADAPTAAEAAAAARNSEATNSALAATTVWLSAVVEADVFPEVSSHR